MIFFISQLNFTHFQTSLKQVTVNRKRKLDQFTSHNTLKLYDFITRKRAKLRAANTGKQNKKASLKHELPKFVLTKKIHLIRYLLD